MQPHGTSPAQRHARHRARLVQDAETVVRERLAALLAHVEEIADLRDQLIEARQAQVWAQLHPHEQTQNNPPTAWLGAGTKEPHEALGVQHRIDFSNIVKALTADARQLAEAMTVEQRKVVQPNRLLDVRREAIWQETEEGQHALREEKQRQRDAYAAEWGKPASW